MRAAVSLVLATTLVTTPLKMVLAQAAQQEAVSVQQTAPDSTTHLIRVPPLTHKTARLWMVSLDKALLNTEFAGPSFIQEQEGGLSTAAAVAIVLGSIVVLGAIVGGGIAAGENNDPESFKSTHSTIEGVGLGALLAIPVTVAAVILLAALCIEDDDCEL